MFLSHYSIREKIQVSQRNLDFDDSRYGALPLPYRSLPTVHSSRAVSKRRARNAS